MKVTFDFQNSESLSGTDRWKEQKSFIEMFLRKYSLVAENITEASIEYKIDMQTRKFDMQVDVPGNGDLEQELRLSITKPD